MNSSDSIDEPDEQTLLRYLDGSLPPGAVARLNTRLKNSTEARRELAEVLVQEIQLIELGHAKRAAAHAITAETIMPGATCERSAETKLVRVPASVWRGWKRLRSAGWVLAAAACLALLLGIAALWFNPRMGMPVVALATDAQLRVEREGNVVPVSDGLALRPGDLLDLTGTNAVAITYAPEKTRVELQPGTTLQLLSWSRGKRFELRQGQIGANVARQRPFKPMFMRTPQAEAYVLGTRFTLTTTTNTTRLGVAEGEVKLTRKSDAAAVKVSAGHYAVVAAATELAALPATGGILRECWRDIPGISTTEFVALERFSEPVTDRDILPTFEIAPGRRDNYVARFRGLLHPPVTGEYTFWLAASDEGVFWISPDERPENKARSLSIEHTQPREWDHPRTTPNAFRQKSDPIRLVAGKAYYVEAVLKAGSGEDHLAVAWQRPGGDREVIAGDYLSPAESKAKERQP